MVRGEGIDDDNRQIRHFRLDTFHKIESQAGGRIEKQEHNGRTIASNVLHCRVRSGGLSNSHGFDGVPNGSLERRSQQRRGGDQ